MSAERAALEAATIRQQCRVLRLPSVAAQWTQLAEQAVRERRTHLGYLEALLQAELAGRGRRGVPVPGDRRAGGEGGDHRHY